MNATPVILTPLVAPTRLRANLTAEQVTAFRGLLGASSLIAFTDGKTESDVVQFMVNVQPNGGGSLDVAIK